MSDYESNDSKRQGKYASYIMMSSGKHLRNEPFKNDKGEMGIYSIPANFISLYPVISKFTYPKGCFASHSTLAAYAGMRKEKIGLTLEDLIKCKWINKKTINYRVYYSADCLYTGNSRDYITIGTEIINNGIWACMEQTRQVVYAVLQAYCCAPPMLFAKDGIFAGGEAYNSYLDFYVEDMELYNEKFDRSYSGRDCTYLRMLDYDKEAIHSAVNKAIGKKCAWATVKRAIDWFSYNGLMFTSNKYECFVFPRAPGRVWNGFQEFKERLARIERDQADHRVSYAAKRAFHAAMKRSSKKSI